MSDDTNTPAPQPNVALADRLEEEVKRLDDIPPSLQTQANIRLINAVHEAAAILRATPPPQPNVMASCEENGFAAGIEQAARVAERYDETDTLSAPKAIASAIRALRTTQPTTLKHPEYAHGISDAELIKEAIEFCNEELDGYEGMEYDDDCEVACQRANTFIRELVRRLEAETPAYWVRFRVSDGKATFWETEVPDGFPLYRRSTAPQSR